MLKGAVFDVDGILMDTEYYQWKGWFEVLKPYGINMNKAKYMKYAGKRGDIIEAEVIRDFNMEIRKGTLIETKQQLVRQWLEANKLKTMPYAREAVEFFARKGISVAVAGGASRDENMLKLKETGLLSLFQAVVSGSDVKRGKPYPDIYALAVKKIGARPEECIAFEDTQYGLQAAKAAGLVCVAVPTEYSLKQDFSKADALVPNLREALKWVGKVFNI